MKEIIFNKKDYKNHEEFYKDVYLKLNGENTRDFDFCAPKLGCSGDILDEFLWYSHNDSNKFIFIGFDKEKIKQERNFDDYKYNIVIKVFERYVQEYPNNKLEFRMENDK